MGKVAYTVMGEVFNSYVGAEERVMEEPRAMREPIEEVALREEQFVIDGKIVSLVSQPPEMELEYKVTWNTQEIPFWENFEGAKACVLAINTNKNGNRAKLISYMREKEVEL